MKAYTLDSIKNEFLDIYAAIQDLTDDEILSGPEDIVRPHFERLQRLIAMDVDDHAADEMLCDREFRSVTKHISHLKMINGLRMEIERAQSIISSPDPWALIKSFPYFPNYLKLACMEYKGGNLKPGDRVVFLGSGPLPLSLVCLCKQYGVKGIGIEKVPEYAGLSIKLIEALELTEQIRIVQGNHFSLPLQDECRLVMVGADACPKDEIFAHLAKVLSVGTKLSYRIYEKGLRHLMDEQPVSELPPELKEYTRIRPEPPVNNTSVFLVKISH
ncbi:MAG: methyltransferase [Deltaproteobacteria bacterium]|nr:methyltransferase [Deltaproteobacteria bacterium]